MGTKAMTGSSVRATSKAPAGEWTQKSDAAYQPEIPQVGRPSLVTSTLFG